MCLQMCCADVVVVAVAVAIAAAAIIIVGRFAVAALLVIVIIIIFFIFCFRFCNRVSVLKVSMYRMAWHDIVSIPTEHKLFNSIRCYQCILSLVKHTHAQTIRYTDIHFRSFISYSRMSEHFFYLSLDNQIRIEWNLYRKFHCSRRAHRHRSHRRCRILFSSFRYDNQNAIDIINHSHLQFCSFDKHIKWVENL